MTNWKTCKIGEVVELSQGLAINSKTKHLLVPKSTLPLLKIRNLINGIEEEYVDEDKVSTKCIAIPEDIIYTRTGQVGLVYTGKIGVVHNNCFKVIPNQEIDRMFLYWLLKQTEIIEIANSIASGSVQKDLNHTAFKSIDISFPEDLPTQRRIAEILSALDDKIEMNRRMNKTLEQMAQTLFRQYFVDGIDKENLSKGWQEGKLSDLVDVKGGTTPSTKQREFWDGNINWTSPKDLSSVRFPVLLNTEKKITAAGLKKISSGLLPVGTLLLSSRAPIGYLAITQIPVAINQGYIAILCEKGYSNYFMLYWLKENMSTIIQNANGSTFLEISKSVFKNIALSIPPIELVKEFDAKVDALFQKLVLNEKEISTLTTLRDTLLPKLMSGEIDVMQTKPAALYEPVLS
ncbi:restriction endonuclease subunit S [Pontibacter qinzhouensis]|uniref:Restriction endonuclease subunit S n=1 Tax=Pontibacter qinzhouensis TaxID=2603253 RepID=A0A5C8KCC4_9BACT|nr:restriction endonuclease subunit S [Pontibacter qinzhouensis]TXK52139.1 restriction endonuclease subunit S [Pontibacter qinzhouensis]